MRTETIHVRAFDSHEPICGTAGIVHTEDDWEKADSNARFRRCRRCDTTLGPGGIQALKKGREKLAKLRAAETAGRNDAHAKRPSLASAYAIESLEADAYRRGYDAGQLPAKPAEPQRIRTVTAGYGEIHRNARGRQGASIQLQRRRTQDHHVGDHAGKPQHGEAVTRARQETAALCRALDGSPLAHERDGLTRLRPPDTPGSASSATRYLPRTERPSALRTKASGASGNNSCDTQIIRPTARRQRPSPSPHPLARLRTRSDPREFADYRVSPSARVRITRCGPCHRHPRLVPSARPADHPSSIGRRRARPLPQARTSGAVRHSLKSGAPPHTDGSSVPMAAVQYKAVHSVHSAHGADHPQAPKLSRGQGPEPQSANRLRGKQLGEEVAWFASALASARTRVPGITRRRHVRRRSPRGRLRARG